MLIVSSKISTKIKKGFLAKEDMMQCNGIIRPETTAKPMPIFTIKDNHGTLISMAF